MGRAHRIIGIYQIKNLVNNKMYIGSSVNIANRWTQHLALLNLNKHPNLHLQKSWDKYGKENFTFAILEEIFTTENIFIKEKEYILKFNTINSINGYNKSLPDMNGYTPMSKEGKKRFVSSIIKRSKNILLLNKETGELEKEYESIGLLVKDLNLPNSKKVYEVLTKKRVAYKGYIFIYKEDYDKNKDYSISKQQHHINNRKPVFQYDMNMNLIKEWDSTQQIVTELNMKLSSIYTAIGRQEHLFGSYWRR